MRGGARTGAGRKALPASEKKIRMDIYLRPDIYKKVKGRAAEILEHYAENHEKTLSL